MKNTFAEITRETLLSSKNVFFMFATRAQKNFVKVVIGSLMKMKE
ncbi:hypothetical protein Rostov7_00041 [Vibrio phage Rostov 7]|nr:hypothetical protein Rostov7_00041 [Vibrio phage Rostov 7]